MFSALSASSITVPVCSVELKQCCRHFELTVSVSYQSVTALVRRRRKNYHWRETCRERVLQKDKTLFSNCPSLFGRAKTVLSTFWADRVCLVSISYCAGYKKKTYHWRETCRERVLQKDKTLWISEQSLRSGRFGASRFSCATKQISLTNVHPIFSYVVNTLSGFLVRKYTIFSSVTA